MPFVRVAVLALAIVLGRVVPASAQDRLPPVEIGVGLSGLVTVPYEDFFTNDFAAPAIDGRITVPLSPRFSFDAGIAVGHRSSQYRSRFEGLYTLQIKQRLRSTTRGSFHAFLTYGLAGYYARVSQEEVRTTQPNGQVLVSPAFRYTEWEAPLATLFGGGVQSAISPRVAVRAEAQLVSLLYIPLGVRISGGVSIPIGR